MTHLSYPWLFDRGDALNRWELSPTQARAFTGTPAVMEDVAAYRFQNGFTAVGDLPCRRAWRREMVGRQVAYPENAVFSDLYLPSNNDKVTSSRFCPTPTHLQRLARCFIWRDTSGAVDFTLTTPGGVRIWVNKQPAATFEPARRNDPQSQTVSLVLDKGRNELLVHFEDLAERDTDWFFELKVASDAKLLVGLAKDLPAEDLKAVESALAEISFDQLIYDRDPIRLKLNQQARRDMPVKVRFSRFAHLTASRPVEVSMAFRKGRRLTSAVAQPAGLDGCMKARVFLYLRGRKAQHVLGVVFTSNLVKICGRTIAARKTEALEFVSRSGQDFAARALAMLTTDGDGEEAGRIVNAALDAVEARADCSDFSMVALLWLWSLEGLDASIRKRLRQTILGWRYWLDEPGDDVMWFWSENHALCFHVSQLLAGQAFGDAHFSCSGRTGAEQEKCARARLEKWFDAVEAHGLAEWNSSSYYPIDFIGLFALYALAEDETLRARARALLDRIFTMVSLHLSGGVPAGSMGRVYDKELLAGPATELGAFAAVAWGEGWLYSECFALPMFCLSDYEPPAETSALRRPPPGQTLQARYTQGDGNQAALSVWKDAHAQLSTVSDHFTGARGHQQHVVDLHFAAHPFARLWINQPGEETAWGEHRPSFWAGNAVLPKLAQHGATALLIFDSTDHLDTPARTHLHAPRAALDALIQRDNWIFVRSGKGWAGIWCSTPLEAIEIGGVTRDEWSASGRKSGWVLVAGSADGPAGGPTSFDKFCDDCASMIVRFDALSRRLRVIQGNGAELSLSYDAPICVNGKPHPFDVMSPEPQIQFDAHHREETLVG